MLFFAAPHVYCHIRGSYEIDVPVKVQTVAAIFMSGSCDPAASCYIVTVRGRHVARVPDVASIDSRIVSHSDYVSPWAVLVVGQVDGIRSTSAGGQPDGVYSLGADHVISVTEGPAVDNVADRLFFVGIAGTAIYLDGTVIPSDWLLRQIGHEKLEPR